MQRVGSDDGRHSFGSCCPEGVTVRCRLLRESDPRTRGPQSPVQSDTTVIITSSGAAPGSPKVGSRMVRGSGAAAGGVVSSFLGQGCRRVRGCVGVVLGDRAALGQGCRHARCCPSGGLRGLLPGRALQRFAEQIIDKAGYTVLKTVEFRSCSSSLLGWRCSGLRQCRKLWRFRSCCLLWVVQFLDKVVDMPVVVQFFDKVVDARCCE